MEMKIVYTRPQILEGLEFKARCFAWNNISDSREYSYRSPTILASIPYKFKIFEYNAMDRIKTDLPHKPGTSILFWKPANEFFLVVFNQKNRG